MHPLQKKMAGRLLGMVRRSCPCSLNFFRKQQHSVGSRSSSSSPLESYSLKQLQQRRWMGSPRLGPPPQGRPATAPPPKAQKRVKLNDLDEALVMHKRYRAIVKLKDILEESQGHVLNVHALGKLRNKFKLARTRRLTTYPQSYPAVVKLTTDADGWQWLELTDEVEDLIAEKERFMREVHEPVVVRNLRKLLMMSQTRSLLVDRLAHLKPLLFYPNDFRSRLIRSYPQYFRVVQPGRHEFLELVDWDEKLAVTAREQRIRDNSLELDELMGNINPHAFPMAFPKGFQLRRRVREYYDVFQELPFPSPYEICPVNPASMEAEKRNLAIVHEMLSMSVEKYARISQLTMFRKDFKLTYRMRALVERFQGIFYTSYKENLFTVFLKEGYSGLRLIERSPLLDYRDRFLKLCLIGPGCGLNHPRRGEQQQQQWEEPSLARVPRHLIAHLPESDVVNQRAMEVKKYAREQGRMDHRGRIVGLAGPKTMMRRSLERGIDVEVLDKRNRAEEPMSKKGEYSIVDLEKSLDELDEEANDWPSED